MKKVIGYPCGKCKHLRDGKITVYQYVSENLTVVRFKMDCCHIEYVKFWNPSDLKTLYQGGKKMKYCRKKWWKGKRIKKHIRKNKRKHFKRQ